MRGIDELDHYELLEIPRTATASEIDRAYRLSQQTYGEGSLALYSVFESSDAEAICKKLDEAFRVLSDPEGRADYDGTLEFDFSLATPEALMEEPNPRAPTSAPTDAFSSESIDDDADEYDVFEDEAGGDFDGLRLRRTRLFRGYEIDDIAEVTKVSGAHLRNIEDENFIDLPADVYVRGFVTAYAKTIGLDPKIVVPSYMARVQESRSGSQRGRFLGRN
jgi:curved DNA-binding protein CbpA